MIVERLTQPAVYPFDLDDVKQHCRVDGIDSDY